MRQLWIQVPKGEGDRVIDVAKTYKGVNLAQLEAMSGGDRIDIVLVHVTNSRVEGFLADLEAIDNLHVNLFPEGVIALRPPPSEAPDQVTDVRQRSPIEIFLAGMQSVGSWWGFLSYAAVAGVVVWIGLYTNTNYLLVAAMLIAPFAGPAMNVAIATARGDRLLLGRSLLRYFSAISLSVAVAALLSFILQQRLATQLMLATSQISEAAVLLPLAAGAAGAIHLIQSERSSLVSGAAVGVLVAASLAPPAGLVGMAIAMGETDMALSGLFLLLLQLAGINLAATLIFRWRGLTARGARYKRGKRGILPIVVSVTVAILAGLLVWQFTNPPFLQRSTRAQMATAAVQSLIQDDPWVQPVQVDARFTEPDVSGQNTLLVTVYAQKQAGIAAGNEEVRDRLSRAIRSQLQSQEYDVTPLIDITVFDAPGSPGN
ncbi:MAG: DUF389 domain-containing protein [Synechococcales bacterium]|nr:DUF389 domain-containing protein [Synechococcales bacterium]